MALNEHNNTRQYTKYKRHVNESSERVDAGTVNTLQEDLNIQQQETNQVKDTAFEERVYTIFNNNLYTNAMFVDYYKSGEYLNLHESLGVEIDYNKTQLQLARHSTGGYAVSTRIYSVHGEDVELNDFFLVTNEYVPHGASLKYYLQTNTGERWPIVPNSLKLPLHLQSDLKLGFKVVIEMKANAMGETPIVHGYAVLYWDAQVEKNYGMTNPDLIRFPALEVGTDDGVTILIRDRAQEDKVVKVLAPLDTVDLTFDWADEDNPGRLLFVKDHWPDYEGEAVTQINKLYYGPYTNSNGQEESVLKKIQQVTNIDGNTKNPTYNDISEELEKLRKQQEEDGIGGDTA
jgi:hypothetical protein